VSKNVNKKNICQILSINDGHMLKRYKQNMIKEAERKAKYYETRAGIAAKWYQTQMANKYYRKARIQYIKLRSLLKSL